ncbi:hypothetical protein DCAR_0833183 [Daucus carota subsp. sativus]|uniref:HTH myb-type domain-containing protein n=1 Tax=Daucus carota subsp. sativus TaxID=79200 RepID=A0AAF1BE34_DAUCS|nr:hypothetical protein DCAR_0833183 [Daucus carota subsp. sativus]
MDPDIARWVLDFLVRQPLDDSTLTSLLTTLPLSNTDTHLTKLLLLKRIDSEISKNAVSESVLGLLEQMEELDYREHVEISDSMKRAYCIVAVDCTVRFLEEGEKGFYFEAVKRIWRTRIGCMMNFERVGLVSEELERWKDEIESAVWDDGACKVLLEKWGGLDVVESVRVYIEEARGRIGPSFLELVTESLSGEAVKEVFGIDKKDIHKEKVQRKSKPSAVKQHKKFSSKTTRGVKIVDNDDLTLEQQESHNKDSSLSPTDVAKFQEGLRTSTSSLGKKAEDPFPDTVNISKNTGNLGRLHLPSPKERVVSPLKKYESPKPLRRRRRLWSNVEEDTLRTGVRKYGVGNWKLILNMYRDIFDDRTEVDLKDKWRNLMA